MIDYLIVGGGMAGCNMAYNLMKNGKTVHMIDEDSDHAASSIAAGIFNPLLPRHRKVAYNANLIYPMITPYYKEFETYLGQQILFEQPIQYFIETNSDLNDWSAMAYSTHLSHWIEVHNTRVPYEFKAPNGFLKIKHSGWVDAKLMGSLMKKKLQVANCFTNARFDYEMLNISDTEINYQHLKAKSVIFCEGKEVKENSWNKNISLKPAKGEILIIKTNLEINYIAQQGVFMAPLGNNLFKVGSTFSWDELDEIPTEAGRKEIIYKFEKFFRGEYEVVDHYAGVRPSSGDRRPILGPLQPYSNAFVLNGLGSKGVALAPYYSELLTQFLLKGDTIEKEVNTSRYKFEVQH